MNGVSFAIDLSTIGCRAGDFNKPTLFHRTLTSQRPERSICLTMVPLKKSRQPVKRRPSRPHDL